MIAHHVLRDGEVMEQEKGQVDHLQASRGDFGASTETRQIIPRVAVVLFNGESQIFSCKELIFWD